MGRGEALCGSVAPRGASWPDTVRRVSLPHRGATQRKTVKPEQSEEDIRTGCWGERVLCSGAPAG